MRENLVSMTSFSTTRGNWAEFFATLEPFDLSDVLKNSRSNDAQRPVDLSWLTLESQSIEDE